MDTPTARRSTRRGLLTAVGSALAATAGCFSDSSGAPTRTPSIDTDPATATETATETAAPRREAGQAYGADTTLTVTVGDYAVHRQVLELGNVGHERVVAEWGVQYLVATVRTASTTGPAPDPTRLALDVVVDGARNPAGEPFPVARHRMETATAAVACPVPVETPPSEVAVVWRREEQPDVQWPAPSSTIDALASVPSYSLSFDVPDSVADDDESFPATITVENGGDRAGRFLAEIDVDGVGGQRFVVFDVPAGETVSKTYGTQVPSKLPATVVLHWGFGEVERELRPTDDGG